MPCLLLLGACDTHSNSSPAAPNDKSDTLIEEVNSLKAILDTIDIKESFKEEDLPYNAYLKAELQPIRENFQRINSITSWTDIQTYPLEESTEGGEVNFYFQDKTLEKIIVRQYGETGKNLTEFYLLDHELSFVFEKYFGYNRPIYWDSTTMKEHNDSEVFNPEDTEIHENRAYFKDEALIHKLESGDCGAPFNTEYLKEEEKRLLFQYHKLLDLNK